MTDHPVVMYLFVLANLAITMGYVFLSVYVVPHVTVSLWRTKIGGMGFFALCGLTHLDMAFHALYHGDMRFVDMVASWHMMLIHIPQAIAVWFFVSGLYIEFVQWGPWGSESPAVDATDLAVIGADRARFRAALESIAHPPPGEPPVPAESIARAALDPEAGAT